MTFERVIISFVIILVAAAIWYSVAHGHEAPSGWSYPANCCGGRDCAPANPLDIQIVQGGFLIKPTGEIVEYGRATPSPDGQYHICRNETTKQILCFFYPPNSA